MRWETIMLTHPSANLTHARHAADKLIKRFTITCPEDIALEDMAMASGVLVVEDHLEGAEARLLRKGGKGIIRVKAGIPEIGRRRFAIAHDLGHWELHADLSQWALCSEADLLGNSGSPPELEANAFASELLMPTALFRPRCERAEPNLALIKALAHEFHTTITATAIRFVEECREMCVVVFSENGRVGWWRSSNRQPGLWIEPRQTIHPTSVAWDCLKDKPVPNTMQRVPAEAWFQELRREPTVEVYEQSMRLGRYPTLLTLLWMVEDDEDDDDAHC
jgi:Zn-dependent peptidase ImmA (M78 family)